MRLILLSAVLISVAACSEAAEPVPGWGTDYAAAVRDAKTAGKPLLIDFGATWCGPCRKLEATTFRDPEVAALVQSGFVAVKVDADQHRDLVEKFGVTGYPTMVVMSPEGREVARRSGYVEAAGFLKWLQPHRGKATAAVASPRREAVVNPEYAQATRAAEARLAERYLALADRAAAPAEAAEYRRKAAELSR